MAEIPGHYRFEQHKHRQFIDAVETLGKTLKEQGPLDTKTAHLVQQPSVGPGMFWVSVDHAGMNGRDAVELDGSRWRSGVRLDSEQPGSPS